MGDKYHHPPPPGATTTSNQSSKNLAYLFELILHSWYNRPISIREVDGKQDESAFFVIENIYTDSFMLHAR